MLDSNEGLGPLYLSKLKSNIKYFRVRAGLTQEDTAKALGISRVTYNNWEEHPEKLSIIKLRRLTKVFNITLYTFFLELEKELQKC